MSSDQIGSTKNSDQIGSTKSSDRPARLPSLTGLRCVLSLTTLLCHALYVFYSDPVLNSTAVQAVMLVGRIGVTCFFVLSGFVLTWSARIGHSAPSFWRRRAWKIVPNHVLAWTIGMVFILLTGVRPPFSAGGQEITPADIWCLLLVSGWWPAQHDGGPNPAIWTVTCEVFFYLLFPVLFVALHRLSGRVLKRTWLIVAAVIVLVPLPVSLIPGPPLTESLGVSYVTLWACFVLPLTRSLEFVLGMATARLLQTGQWPHAIPRTVTMGLPVLMCALLPLLPPHYALGPLFAMHTAVFIVAIARGDIKGRSGMLARPRVVLLGDASYALYIIHFPLLLIAAHWIGPVSGPRAIVVMTACMAAMPLVTLLVYRYFEKPLLLRYSRPTPSRAPLPAHPEPPVASSESERALPNR
ncbi:acyltransferase [Streptomyces sp. NBC_01142]|uniref:acyltransferase family protein n=1 Tax=Streptomyces sp. NBC_01142 TaxID=2975865 RepID=UPI002252D4FB|nr:acyltransferase [Streptomyces sp. NBC_01142]MCX4820919.1 acyltransferase [Streptomyces sp. NBC_01142]